MVDERMLLAGCGILRKELGFLIRKNNWPLDTHFLDSALHVDFNRLGLALATLLEQERVRRPIVFYGACHPRMDALLSEAGLFRTGGQNCCEMLLGGERFLAELDGGAYFLLEEWAQRWEQIVLKTFNTDRLSVVRAIFRDRSYLLAVRTPCSGDFTSQAEAAAEMVDLPLRWLDVSLEHLEAVMQEAIDRKRS